MSRWLWMAGQAALIAAIVYGLLADDGPQKMPFGAALLFAVIVTAFLTALVTNLSDWTGRVWSRLRAPERGVWLIVETALLIEAHRLTSMNSRASAGWIEQGVVVGIWAVILTFAMAGLFALWDRLARMIGRRSQAGRIDAALPQAADHGITWSPTRNGSTGR